MPPRIIRHDRQDCVIRSVWSSMSQHRIKEDVQIRFMVRGDRNIAGWTVLFQLGKPSKDVQMISSDARIVGEN